MSDPESKYPQVISQWVISQWVFYDRVLVRVIALDENDACQVEQQDGVDGLDEPKWVRVIPGTELYASAMARVTMRAFRLAQEAVILGRRHAHEANHGDDNGT